MRFLILFTAFIIGAVPVAAQTPLPPAHPVQDVEQELKDTQAREKALKKEMKSIKSDLNKKRDEMVRVAREIKSNEKKLITLEQNIQTKNKEQIEIEERLKNDRGAISDLVLALERMRRAPPEAILARPGAPLETAQSAMLLQSVLPSIYKRAEDLKKNLDELTSIITDLKQSRDDVLKTSKKLEKDHKRLTALLSERENLYAKTSNDAKKQQVALKQIALQASSLKDLVARIEKKQKEEDKKLRQAKQQKTARTAPPRTFAKTPVPRAGQAQLPISGLIKTAYGKTDNIGAVSKGLKIQSRQNALVVAPMGGVVDYAGAFKGYGQLVILKHEKGYHSLIAGLGKIDTVVGRAVSSGEPIGKMGQNTGAPTLYYELRYKGQPINPAKKISGL